MEVVMFAGKVDDDPAIHGGVGGLIAIGIAYCAWKLDHVWICVIAAIIGIFLLVTCFAAPFDDK